MKIDERKKAASVSARSRARLTNLPMDWVKIYWPDNLTPDPRLWVTSHLSQGMATKATIDAALAYDANAEHKISLRKLSGERLISPA